MRCNKLWKFTYVDGFESVNPPTKEQRFGVGFHKLLEQYYLGQPTNWAEVDLEGSDKSSASALLEAYKGHYPITAKPANAAEWLGAEIPFQLDDIHGIFDVIESVDGGITITEHKTTKSDFSADEFYWEKVKTDWQVGLYQIAARRLHKTDNVKVLYDVVRVPQQRARRGESAESLRDRIAADIEENPTRYFGRGEIKWSSSSLAELEKDLAQVQQQIAGNQYPRSRKCFEYRRKCEMYSVCFEGESLENEKLFQVRKRR